MNRLLANTNNNPFGTIKPPAGQESFGKPDITAVIGGIVGTGIRIFITVAALAVIIYMLWGAWDWISSNGEKEKIAKARQKITHSILGFIFIFIALAIFGVITGDIAGIIKNGPNGWEFSLPKFASGPGYSGECKPPGTTVQNGGDCCNGASYNGGSLVCN